MKDSSGLACTGEPSMKNMQNVVARAPNFAPRLNFVNWGTVSSWRTRFIMNPTSVGWHQTAVTTRLPVETSQYHGRTGQDPGTPAPPDEHGRG